MVDLKQLFDSLSKLGVDFYTGVPDSLLNDFCLYLSRMISDNQHIMAANEGNAIGIAAGHYFATGKIPVVYMQNSGIGNATNPLLSLTHDYVYGIPMVLVIGWRGDPAILDHAQHRKQGELTPVLMKDMDIPYMILDSDDTVIEKFAWAVAKAKEISSPAALIVKKAILTEKVKRQIYPESKLMNREEAISAVVEVLGSGAIYLGTTGRATREVHEQLNVHGVGEGHEFQNVGSMGHVSSVGLGLALSKPNQKIVVFDGDAAVVMHMGALATNCRYKAGNMIHIVLNNGVNESVGGQPSAGYIVNLTDVAIACGYRTPGHAVETKEELQRIIRDFGIGEMPLFVDVHVRQGIRSDLPKLDIDHKAQKDALMNNLLNRQ
jgi:phosphonopyruvate decarboxylase